MTFISKNTQSWTIVQISDTHLMDQEDFKFVQMNPEHSFHGIMRDIQQRYPELDAIVHTGDLAQVPVPATYARYLAFMHRLNIPFYQIPGNHDEVEYFPFHQQQNRVHAIHLGRWTIMLLNSAVKNQIDGRIEPSQLAQLDQLLTEHAGQHVILACHHHPFAMQSHWVDQHKLKNTADLTEVMVKHQNIKAVLFGHVHQDSLNIWNNIPFYSTPSTSVQFKPHSDDFALGQEAPGYRVLHLKDNGEFDTQVHRVENLVGQINNEISGY